MKKVPYLGAFSDYSEMEEELRRKVEKERANVESPPQGLQLTSINQLIAHFNKEKRPTRNKDSRSEKRNSSNAVAGPSQLSQISENLDEVMKDENSSDDFYCPPAFNTRWRKEREVMSPTSAATRSSSTKSKSKRKRSPSPPILTGRASSAGMKRRKFGDNSEALSMSRDSSLSNDATQDATQDDDADSLTNDPEKEDLYTISINDKGQKEFTCKKCTEKRPIRSIGDMNRHLESRAHQKPSWHCVRECGNSYTRKDALVRHINKVHPHKGIVVDPKRQIAVRKRSDG